MSQLQLDSDSDSEDFLDQIPDEESVQDRLKDLLQKDQACRELLEKYSAEENTFPPQMEAQLSSLLAEKGIDLKQIQADVMGHIDTLVDAMDEEKSINHATHLATGVLNQMMEGMTRMKGSEHLSGLMKAERNALPRKVASSNFRNFRKVMNITPETVDWYSELKDYLKQHEDLPEETPDEAERWILILKCRWMTESLNQPDYDLLNADLIRIETVYNGLYPHAEKGFHAHGLADGVENACAVM